MHQVRRPLTKRLGAVDRVDDPDPRMAGKVGVPGFLAQERICREASASLALINFSMLTSASVTMSWTPFAVTVSEPRRLK